jgi:hypothetical protein
VSDAQGLASQKLRYTSVIDDGYRLKPKKDPAAHKAGGVRFLGPGRAGARPATIGPFHGCLAYRRSTHQAGAHGFADQVREWRFYFESNIYVIAGHRPGNPIEPAIDGTRAMSSASAFRRNTKAAIGLIEPARI